METYYAYLRWCTDFNERNLIDPAHDKMEWNHTLPQCIFGDQPIGQWLTLKQHAIASALQTLAFNRCTICAWHVQHLPDPLWEKCKPLFSVKAAKGGATGGKTNVETGHIYQIATPEGCKQGGHTQGRKNVESKTGMFKRTFEELSAKSKEIQARRFQCLVTGYITSASALTRYQRAKGIDTSLRIQIK